MRSTLVCWRRLRSRRPSSLHPPRLNHSRYLLGHQILPSSVSKKTGGAISALVREGAELQDYQTVDLGQAHLRNPAWTRRGSAEHRDGGPEARYGTHIRFRRYRADASVLSAVSLWPANEVPTLNEIGDALTAPARPLFIGRKPCLPATRLFIGVIEDATSLTDALARVPNVFPDRWPEVAADLNGRAEVTTEWPVDDERDLSPEARLGTYRVIDRPDWRNQLHGGERVVKRGTLAVNPIDTSAAGGTS